MLFKEIKDVKYRKYASDVTEVSRHIELQKETAEYINKVIAVANKGNKNFKINNSMLFTVAIKNYFEELERLTPEEAIQLLRTESLAEIGVKERRC